VELKSCCVLQLLVTRALWKRVKACCSRAFACMYAWQQLLCQRFPVQLPLVAVISSKVITACCTAAAAAVLSCAAAAAAAAAAAVLSCAAAERDIPAGGEVLHTYGDLADAATAAQTYGFIDLPPWAPPPPAPAPASKKRRRAEAAAPRPDKDRGQQQQLSSNPHNYVVLQMTDLLDAVNMVAAAARLCACQEGPAGGLATERA